MTDETSVIEAIAERSRHFMATYCAGDAAALVDGYFAPDEDGPMAVPPGGNPPVRGRAALKEMFAGMFAGMPEIRLETVELVVADTMATELGKAHLSGPNGASALGRYIVCWMLTAEGWRAKIDFFAEDGWTD